MGYENVKLWFAKNEDDYIVTIDEIKGKNSAYSCPVCGSRLKPKAIKSKQVTSHFAHVDASKCNSESMIHWWFKHKFIEKGDQFKVLTDIERTYVCKEITVEKSYLTSNADYKPDVTVITECGNTIYFEMAFSNMKKVKDYLDIWLELKNIVVEIDIRSLMMASKAPAFKALFYSGKCFNTKRNDTYYNTIGKYKEEKLKGKVDEGLKERIRKLDWFWDDIIRYKKGEVDIEHIITLIHSIDSKGYDEQEIIITVIKKQKCISLLEDYREYIISHLNRQVELYKDQFSNIGLIFDYNIEKPKKKHEVLFRGFSVKIFEDIINIRKASDIDSYFLRIYDFCLKNYELNKPLREIESLFDYSSICTSIDHIKHPIKLEIKKDNFGNQFIKINRIGYKEYTFDEIAKIPDAIKNGGFLTLENAELLDNVTREIKEEFNYVNEIWEIQTSISSSNEYTLTLKSKNNRVKPICGHEYLNFRLTLPRLGDKSNFSINYNEVDYDYNKDSKFRHLKSIMLSKIYWVVSRVKPLDDHTLDALDEIENDYFHFEYAIKNSNEILIKIYRTKQRMEFFELILMDYKLYMDTNIPNWRSIKNIMDELITKIPRIEEHKNINLGNLVYELNNEYGFNDKYSRKYRFLYYIDNKGDDVIELSKTGYYGDGEAMFLYKVSDVSLNISKVKKELIDKLSTFTKEKFSCIDCYNSFNLTFGEAEFYDKKEFKYPKRCKSCRLKRKSISA